MAGIARFAPWQKAAPWDPVGLQLGDPSAVATTVAVCHEVTDAVLGAVESSPPSLLVSYHPLLFRPTTQMVAGSGPTGRAFRLIRAGVGLVIAHTNFDVAPGGASDALADSLSLENVKGFGPLETPESVKIVTFVPEAAADHVLEAVVAQGAGVIGNYSHCSFRAAGTGTFIPNEVANPSSGEKLKLNREPELRLEFSVARTREAAVIAALVDAHPYEEPSYDVYDRRGEAGLLGRVGTLGKPLGVGDFAADLQQRLGPCALRVAGDEARRIQRIAVIPGSGSDFIAAAANVRADALVTGDLTHHRVREAFDRGLVVFDPGHAPTERPGLQRLLERIREIEPATESLLEFDPDPWSAAIR